MGEVATRLADAVVVTSDNPRSEDPETILQQIVVGIKKTFADVKGHVTITDRREAIGAALASARGGDLVVIAGKGHETYQILRDRTIPFDDRVVAREALTALGYGAPGSGPMSEGR
jgi:UDP-N-acetylmuramoyl-L-alanyl-D-glutamate--2,6-diaminopimelate ligase